MKIYRNQNVFDAALDRIRYLYDEFPEVTLSFSGGKDSTVVLHLALIVAAERHRLPLKVLFIDQEAEWQFVISYIRTIMSRPDVTPLWYQIPFRIENAASKVSDYLRVWEPGVSHMREHDPLAITVPPYAIDKNLEFYKVFNLVVNDIAKGGKIANLGGVRTEESPSRFVALTHMPTYKWITWGKKLDRARDQYTFYPIYDWSFTDVWAAIHSNSWEYCKLYDYQYRYGIDTRDMRVSNLHHETAVMTLFYLQELEPETYEALCRRMPGIHSAGKMGFSDYFVRELPFMFPTWLSYRDFLLDKLVTNPEWIMEFKKRFARMDKMYGAVYGDKMYQTQIQSILANDWGGTKCKNWENNPNRVKFRKVLKGRAVW